MSHVDHVMIANLLNDLHALCAVYRLHVHWVVSDCWLPLSLISAAALLTPLLWMKRWRRLLLRLAHRMLRDLELWPDLDRLPPLRLPLTPPLDTPVWLLGQRHVLVDSASYSRLSADLISRVWLTYRRGFEPISSVEGPSSDSGWGCMLRCGQMVLAEAVLRGRLGRRWLWSPQNRDAAYLQLIGLLADHQSAPLSLHRLALVGARVCRKPVGTWFGPNTVAQSLLHLVEQWAHSRPLAEQRVTSRSACPAVYVAMDGVLDKSDAIRTAGWKEDGEEDGGVSSGRPLLCLIPLRLGLSELNPVYVDSLSSSFRIPFSLGAIGGTPNHALYFVASFGDSLLYLDPHTTQHTVHVGDKVTEDQIRADCSYHCLQPGFMPIARIDPSLALAFLCANHTEFSSLCEHIQRLLVDGRKHPMFELCDKFDRWSEELDACEAALTLPCASSSENDRPKSEAIACTTANNFSVVGGAGVVCSSDEDFEIL